MGDSLERSELRAKGSNIATDNTAIDITSTTASMDAGSSQHYHQSPDRYVIDGIWSEEPIYYPASHGGGSNSKQMRFGVAFKRSDTNDYVCFKGHDGCVYRVGGTVKSMRLHFIRNSTNRRHYFVNIMRRRTDWFLVSDNVYLDSQQPEMPYFICGIQGFKMVLNFECINSFSNLPLKLNCIIFWMMVVEEEGSVECSCQLVLQAHRGAASCLSHTESGSTQWTLGERSPIHLSILSVSSRNWITSSP